MATPLICGFCGCGCRLYLDLSEASIPTGVMPSETSPVNAGRLCRRGWHLFQPHRSTERWMRPQVREGSLRNPCSWEEAANLLAQRLSRYTPQEVAFIGSPTSSNEDAYALVRYARSVIGTPHLDFPGRGNWARVFETLAASLPPEALQTSLDDVVAADLVMLLGMDEGTLFPQITARLHEARWQGKPMVVISQGRGDLAQLATLFLCPYPRSEMAWLTALRETLPGSSQDLRRWNLLWEEAGLSPEEVEPLWRMLQEAQHLLMVLDTTSPSLFAASEALAALAQWLAEWGKAGKRCKVLLTAERCNTRGAYLMGLAPNRLPGGFPLGDSPTRQRLEMAWECALPLQGGMDLPQILRAAAQGQIKALFLVGSGWEGTYPWPQEWRQALEQVEFLAVMESFPEEGLAEKADVLLPRPLPGETEGTLVNLEGRVQRSGRALQPSQEIWAEWQLWQALAERAGRSWGWDGASSILREIVALTEMDPALATLKEGEWAWAWPKRPFPLAVEPPPSHRPVPASEEFPLYAVPASHPSDWWSEPLFLQSSTLRREIDRFPAPYLLLHPEVARAQNLREGSLATLVSPIGSFRLYVRYDPNVPFGRVFIPRRFIASVGEVLGQAAYEESSGAWLYPATIARIETRSS